MSSLFDRVKTLPNIFGIEFSFTGTLIPPTIYGCRRFYNAPLAEKDFQEAYFGYGSVSFTEESEKNAADISYIQNSLSGSGYQMATWQAVLSSCKR